jgi:YrbI family 3-deoxy-D-manno-octulosonate 8-phosphate phosphatase
MRWIFTDVDGVLTDGRVQIDVHGNETKIISYRDLDAIGAGRRAGYDFVFITGEDTEMVRILAKRFGVGAVYSGAKDKVPVITKIAEKMDMSVSEVLYIGDSDRDVPVLEICGFGIAPKNGTISARLAANYVTEVDGGHGVLLEVVDKLIAGTIRYPGK